MSTYRIVCRLISNDQSHIEEVGLTDDMSKDTANFRKTPSQINDMIANGAQCFVTDEAGKEVEVVQFGDNFITTKPDGIIKNNLLHLRKCNFT